MLKLYRKLRNTSGCSSGLQSFLGLVDVSQAKRLAVFRSCSQISIKASVTDNSSFHISMLILFFFF